MIRKLFILVSALTLACTVNAQQEVRQTTIPADATQVPETDGASFERIVWEKSLIAGHDYALIFPAVLDGYYFGPDAQRAVINAMAEQDGVWHLNVGEPMADTDNFESGNVVYLVRSTIDVPQITFVTAGLRTSLRGAGWRLRCIDVTGYVADTELSIRQILTAADTAESSAWYDLLGRRIGFGAAPAEPGTYINRGQRVIIK